MYIRKVKTKIAATGAVYFTYKLVMSERINGIPTQINLLSLGKLENFTEEDIKKLGVRIEELYEHQNTHQCDLFTIPISPTVEDLAQFFTFKLIQKQFHARETSGSDIQEHSSVKQFVEIDINSITEKVSEQIGGEFLCKQAITELGLDTFLAEELSFTHNQINHSLLALTGRLLYPSSDSQTARWLNENSAALDFYPLDSAKVNKNQLYFSANQLYEHKAEIENFLNCSTERILNLKRKIVLYDLTNSHFEGQMNGSERATFGHNKQKRFDCRQITLGMLTDEDGFPIHTRYYDGNVSEPSTLEKILTDLSCLEGNLFTGDKPCIIMDAGIATEESIKLLLKKGYEYICVSRSGHKDLINKVVETELVTFKNKSDKELAAQLFKQDFQYEDENKKMCVVSESLVYIKSPDKQKKEVAIDEKKCQRFEQGLKMIEKTINSARGQKSIAQINQRLGRLKEKNRGIIGFFEVDLKNNATDIISIAWKRNENVPKEKSQGVYFLRTNISETSEEKLWNLYRLENEVEEGFGTLKSELGMRPNFHQSDATIEAHINLCVLAYYIVSFIRYRLKKKGIDSSWSEICRIMAAQKRTIQVSRTKSEKALWTKTCTVPNQEIENIFEAMNYKKIPFYRKSIIV